MKLHAFPSQAPTHQASPQAQARQGLNAKIWVPKTTTFPLMDAIDVYHDHIPETLEESLKNPKVLPVDLQNVLESLLKVFHASIDFFISDSSYEQNIPERDFEKFANKFMAEYASFIKPVLQTKLSNTMPTIKKQKHPSIDNTIPLAEAGIPEKPYQHVITTIQSIGNGIVEADEDKQKLIDLKIQTGIEKEDENVKVLYVNGQAGETPISEYIRAVMETNLHGLAVQDPGLARMIFLDKNGKPLPKPPA